MQVTTQEAFYQDQNNNRVDYKFETYEQGDKDPIFVVRNAQDNQEHKFGQNLDQRTEKTIEQAQVIQDKHKIEPEKAQLFQERPDGDFDKVTFELGHNERGQIGWREEREQISPEKLKENLTAHEFQTLDQLQDDKYEKEGTLRTPSMNDPFTDFDKNQESQQQEMARAQELAKNQEIPR